MRALPQLFDQVSKSRTDNHDARIIAEFDSTFGFPTRFRFDDPKGEDEFGLWYQVHGH
jgi:hypothetical protein